MADTQQDFSHEELIAEQESRLCRSKLAFFIQSQSPWYHFSPVHILLCHIIDRVIQKKPGWDRVQVFMPPRAGKTQIISKFAPAFYVGNHPNENIMAISHSERLSTPNSREVRGLLKEPTYGKIFPGVKLDPTSQSTSRWDLINPNKDGQVGSYSALTVGASIAGLGFSLGILDDVVSEQSANSPNELENIYEWYSQGFLTRRMTGASIIILNTRWSNADLSGRLLQDSEDGGEYVDKWKVFSIPAILDEKSVKLLNTFGEEAQYMNQLQENRNAELESRKATKVPRITHTVGGSFDPVRWPKNELMRQKANISTRHWSALYMQTPMTSEGTILKSEYWRKFKGDVPPECHYILAFYDTAFEENEAADYSARTTWGIFYPNGQNGLAHMILLESWKGKVDFPTLRQEVIDHAKKFRPDEILIEKRASGISLIQELRRTGLPVLPWLPPGQVLSGGGKGRGKMARAHASSVILQQGLVWYMDRRWADDVIAECEQYPFSDYDDITDTVTMALLYLRKSMLELKQDFRGTPQLKHEDDDEHHSPAAATGREQRLRG